MIGKKSVVLAGFLLAFLSQGFAQDNTPESSSSYDIRDSSVIPARRLPQHNEFLNNAYPFPAKPRNQWEVGVKGGMSTVSGDVRSRYCQHLGLGFMRERHWDILFLPVVEYDYMDMLKGSTGSLLIHGYAANPMS